MTRRTILSTVVLVLLVAILGKIGYSRGFRLLFDARPATLATSYVTEEAWIVDEIVRDVTEMSVGQADGAAPTVLASAQPDTYTVSAASLTSPVQLDLHADLWSPSAFAGLARSLLGSLPAQSAAADAGGIHAALLDLTAATLVAANDSISRALRVDLRNAAAHEAAALTLGAFALREPLGRQADTRWAMNRMTAHLALAEALRGSRAPTVDGQLASVVLETLENHQARALAALEHLEAETGGDAVAAWVRALRLRITEDWRMLAEPRAASRLEQREYVRARRATIRSVTGASDLERLGRSMDVDWFRLINGSPGSVDDAGLVTEGLDLERAELDDVYMRMHGRPLVHDELADLNTPASRYFNGADPLVLPWGAWAEFGQRRLAVVISGYDSYLRHSLGSGNAADTAKAKLRAELGMLWTFPSSTIWWTKGPRGLEADLQYLNEAIAEGVEHPHRLTARAWTFIEYGSKYEPVRAQMPSAQAWYFAPAPRTAYEAGLRIGVGGLRPVQDYARLLQEAPYDFGLAYSYLTAKYGKKNMPLDDVTRLVGARMEYDTRAVSAALEAVGDDDRGVPLLEAACGFSQGYCKSLGDRLARGGRDDEAARAYERALNDPGVDGVTKANWADWLVHYYYTKGRIGPALQLAEQSASTGAAAGLVTAAKLYERLGRMDDAERAYRSNAESYDAPGPLLGFYYRAFLGRKLQEYEPSWHRELERVFPQGLIDGPVDPGPPSVGVFVENDSPASVKIGVQAGDVIIAVDGWHVGNMGQYRAVRAFPLDGRVTLTVARGAAHSTVEIADRRFVPDFRIANYPVRGWIEK